MQNTITKFNKVLRVLFLVLAVALAFGSFLPVTTYACDSGCPAPTPAVLGTCFPDVDTVNVDDPITWTANVAGGNGTFSYSWSGTDGLVGSDKSFTVSYSTAGLKTAIVAITSGNITIQRLCTVTVVGNTVNQLSVSCVANPSSANIGDNVTYTATVSGGTGNSFYSWNGTDGLFGQNQSVTKSYSTSGTKTANVTVTNGSQSASATCSSNIQQQNYNNLTASCYGNPSNVNTGQSVTWYGSASGGNGNYTYSWSGTDNLYGYNQTVYQVYNYSGTKTATLTVNSNGQTYSTTCYINVNNNSNITLTQNPNGQLSSGVFLSQVPYTGAGPSLKVTLFGLGLLLWSAFAAYMILVKGKKNELATPTGTLSMREKIEQFKRKNATDRGYQDYN